VSTSSGADRAALLVAVVAAAMTASSVAGCVTATEGEAMRTETAALRARLDAMDKRDADGRQQLQRLRAVLDEATALLTRNSADVGAKAVKAETDIAALGGRIAELQHALDGVARELGAERVRLEARIAALEQGQTRLADTQQKVVDKVAPTIPEDKEALWREATVKMGAAQNEEARRFYRAFIQRFPQDSRAPQALVAVGQSFIAERRHAQATAELQKVLDAYPRAPEVPEAMWLLAATFVELKFCTDAKALLADLAKRYPKSPRAAEVKDRMRQIDKIVRDRTRCTS